MFAASVAVFPASSRFRLVSDAAVDSAPPSELVILRLDRLRTIVSASILTLPAINFFPIVMVIRFLQLFIEIKRDADNGFRRLAINLKRSELPAFGGGNGRVRKNRIAIHNINLLYASAGVDRQIDYDAARKIQLARDGRIAGLY